MVYREMIEFGRTWEQRWEAVKVSCLNEEEIGWVFGGMRRVGEVYKNINEVRNDLLLQFMLSHRRNKNVEEIATRQFKKRETHI